MSGYNVLEQDKTYLVRSATNNSNIAAISTSTAGEVFVGGILGYGIEEVSLNIVKNTGHLKSYSCNYDSIGGIVGYVYSSSVSNALFTGNIEGSQKDQILTYLGGIIGQIDTEGVIENCINIGTIKSNANYKDIAVIGGIVGRSYDHLFTVDGKCAYGQSSEGFEKAVGLQEYRKGLVISEEDKKYCETIFTSPVSADFVSGLDSEIWQWDNDVKLLIPNIYLNGCQTSFSLENDSKLTEKGALVSNLEVKLRYTGTGNNSGIIKFGIVDENLNYKILTTGYDGSEKTLIEWIEAADLPSGVTIDYTKLTCIFITLTLTEGQNK